MKILGTSVKKALICASIVAGTVVSTPAIARADGYFNSINARFYTSYVHYSISYSVFDGSGYCVKDEYGFYNDPACDGYDSNTATLDARVLQLGGWYCTSRCTRLRHKRVYSEQIFGDAGRATEDVYNFEAKTPFCWSNVTYSINYQVVFRLFDPVTDTPVDQTSKFFHATCR